MDPKPVLTTGDVASHCHVAQETVANWIKGGQLKAYKTPGRHRRIRLGDFREFLVEHGMPPLGAASDLPQQNRILVVDDDPAVVRLIVRLLEKNGRYETATAADGFEAGIQIARFKPDLVILDLMMPHLDGFKVCSSIRSAPETSELAVLVVTGYHDDENLDRAREAGADYCMTKPLSMEALSKRVHELLESRVQTTVASTPS
jgi:excisionase family DNA binding protein